MRMLMRVEMAHDKANALVRSGAMSKTIQSILDEQKPEAAYFLTSRGKRCGLLVVDVKDPSQIPALAEPWFVALGADIELSPVMLPADLAKAGPAIEAAGRKYGG